MYADLMARPLWYDLMQAVNPFIFDVFFFGLG